MLVISYFRYMSFKIGIVGLPNVGKSTLFKALTKKPVAISNYPFCTIDPNVGVVTVPDERLKKLAAMIKPPKLIPTIIEFVDIAGLVKEAHKGQGLGNKFLSHIREVEAIVQVVRAFSDVNVAHVEGQLDPERDMEIVNLELILADLEAVNNQVQKLKKEAQQDKKLVKKFEVIQKVKETLDQSQPARTSKLETKELVEIKDLNLLTLKPTIYCFNVDENQAVSYQPRFSKFQLKPGEQLVISAKIESELAELSEKEAKEYLKELGLKKSGLENLILKTYQLLNLITFYTYNEKELRAWTVKAETRAPEAAGVIHTDFQEKFIRAEVINWQALVKAGGWQKAKDQGLIRTEGKDYAVADGEVIFFLVGK